VPVDYRISRERMVERHLARRGIKDGRVLEAFRTVPRHAFVEEALQAKAYSDHALPIGEKQTISQPYVVARMTELARIRPDDRVLEIGTGSGYQTAILARLAGQVYSIERIASLARRARTVIASLGLESVVHIKVFDGTYGWSEWAPYQAIVVSAASPDLPAPLLDQLAPEGRLVIPIGAEERQDLTVVTLQAEGPRIERHGVVSFVRLIGRFGWSA